MDYETYNELCYGIHTVEAPDEIPSYDPKDEEDYLVDCYLNDEAYLEAHISSLLGDEVKL